MFTEGLLQFSAMHAADVILRSPGPDVKALESRRFRRIRVYGVWRKMIMTEFGCSENKV